jgi:DnaJ-class molecular chaperone
MTVQQAQPIPRPHLIAALAGDDVCRTCQGRGSLVVDDSRNTRTCPMCRGAGLTQERS